MSNNKDIYPILTDWLSFLKGEKAYSENTLEAYEIDTKIFIDFISRHKAEATTLETLKNLSITDFRAFLSNLSNVRTTTSRARTLSSIKSFFKYLEKNSLVKNDALYLVKTPKIPKKLPRSITSESSFEAIEMGKYLEGLKRNAEPWVAIRNETLLFMLYGTGLRISEALDLKIKDFSNEKFLHITGKGGKGRIVPLIDKVLTAYKKLVEVCPFISGNDDFLFYGKNGKQLNAGVVQKLVRDIRNFLNLPEGVTPHAFRHSFASHLLSESNGDIRSIQELLGHSSLSTTQKYTKIDTTRLLKTFNDIS